jgi:ribosomal protein S18 acetylase RimI-like enzyme
MPTTQLEHRDLDHQGPLAAEILRVLHASYRVEASLLGIADFPPLARTVEQVREAETVFLGSWHDDKLVGVAEVERLGPSTVHINSFTVDPSAFRKGVGASLLGYLLTVYGKDRVTVATAAANHPAIRLYEKLGFGLQHHWRQPQIEIDMVTLILRPT